MLIAAVVSAAVGGYVLGVVTAGERDGYDERVVGDLLRMERRKALVPHGNEDTFADLLPLKKGRGFPLVAVGRIVKATPAFGYGPVTEPCDGAAAATSSGGATSESCSGETEHQVLPITDGRAETVVITATMDVEEVLASDDIDVPPSRLRLEWLVAGPASLSPPDPREVADALVALGRVIWVLTEPGSNTTYGTFEQDPLLVAIAWPPFGMALIGDDEMLEPVAGPIPTSLDTLSKLRRTLRGAH